MNSSRSVSLPDWATDSPLVARDIAAEVSTEQTTTSTWAVDLVATSRLSIPTDRWVRICGVARKTGGAAVGARLGLKLDSTTVYDAASATTALAAFTAADEAQWAQFSVIVPPRRDANYPANPVRQYALWNATGRVKGPAGESETSPAVPAPSATIASVTVTGIVLNTGGITLGVRDVVVEVLGT